MSFNRCSFLNALTGSAFGASALAARKRTQ